MKNWILSIYLIVLVGCAGLSQHPSQKIVATTGAPSEVGTGNTQETTTHQETTTDQTTAGTAVHGTVNTLTQNTGLTPLGLAITFILVCEVIAAFFFGIVAKIEVQGVMANLACWIGVAVFGIVLPLAVYAIATGRI